MSKNTIFKCRWCGEEFNISQMQDQEWIMPFKGHYYHTNCWLEKETPGSVRPMKPERTESDRWTDAIMDLFYRDMKVECNFSLIHRQIKGLVKKGYTIKGIYYTLNWFYLIKRGDWEKSNGGIGIVPYVYEEASQYWCAQEEKQKGIITQIEEQISLRESQPVVYKRQEKIKRKDKYSLEE